MSKHDEKKSDIQILAEKIKDIRIAMMTTQEADGTLRSRPMATQDTEFDGTLWFFTYADTPKVDDVEQNHRVNISYAKPDDSLFVAVSGTSQLVRDRQKIKKLWKPFLKAWFPEGEDDPNIALLKVQVESAEYWDSPGGKAGSLFNAVKSALTGSKDKGDVDVKLDMK